MCSSLYFLLINGILEVAGAEANKYTEVLLLIRPYIHSLLSFGRCSISSSKNVLTQV